MDEQIIWNQLSKEFIVRPAAMDDAERDARARDVRLGDRFAPAGAGKRGPEVCI